MDKDFTLPQTELDTPKLIIQVAYKLFMELGYRAVSTRKIAEECGITQPALYHHFKNKQEIYVEVTRASINQTENSLMEIIVEFSTLQERLYHISCFFLTHYQEDLMQMFHDLQHEMPEHIQKEISSHWYKGFLQPIIRMMEEAVNNGEIRPFHTYNSNSFEISLMLLNIIKSAIQPHYLKKLNNKQQQQEIDKKAHLIVQIFLFGVKLE